MVAAVRTSLDCIENNIAYLEANDLPSLLRQANADFEKMDAVLSSDKMGM